MSQKPWRILKEYANGVMDERGRFYPYKTSTAVSSTGTLLAAKQNVRFYIKSLILSVSQSGVIAAGIDYIQYVENNIQRDYLVAHGAQTQATDFNEQNLVIPIEILADSTTAISFTKNSTYANVRMIYSEVDDI